MSDSESDFISFPREPEVAHGYNAPSTSSWQRHHFSNSRMNLPRNFERQRYPESFRPTANMYYERETSPMSVQSYRDTHYQYSQYSRGFGSHRSMINARCASPNSERSINSNLSTMTALNISNVLLQTKFNEHDFQILEKAWRKFIERGRNRKDIKMRRKKIEKRRKKKFPSNGYDSGELGSDSSISDDLRSKCYASTLCTGSVTGTRSYSQSSLVLARAIKNTEMYKDRTADFQQNYFRNVMSMASGSIYKSSNEHENSSVITRNPKINSSFQIGSHRFNKTVSALPIKESQAMSHHNNKQSNIDNKTKVNRNCVDHKFNNSTCIRDSKKVSTNVIESDEEDMFTNRENDVNNFTLSRNTNAIISKNNIKQNSNLIVTKTLTTSKINFTNNVVATVDGNDFEFARPQFPIKKSLTKVKEVLLSKSPSVQCVEKESQSNKKSQTHKESHIIDQNDLARPQFPINKSLTRTKEKILSKSVQCAEIESENSNKNTRIDKESDIIDHSSSDVSSRPSFMKRKLFTQTLDVTECKNISSESSNSPQANVYNRYAKEKNKARKLAAGQSCLNRDINQEKNLLELIQDIVPAARMNLTMSSTRVERSATHIKANSQKRKAANDPSDRWDITSIISCNNDSNVSDTYTDEDIINVDSLNKKKKMKTSLEFYKEDKNKSKSMINKSRKLKNKDIKSEKKDTKDKVNQIENEIFKEILKKDKEDTTKDVNDKEDGSKDDNEKKNTSRDVSNKGDNGIKKRYSCYIDRFWNEDTDIEDNDTNKGHATMETVTENDEKFTPVCSTGNALVPEVAHKDKKNQENKEFTQNKTKCLTNRLINVIKCATNNKQDKTNKTNKIIKKTTPDENNKKLTSVFNTAKTLKPEDVNKNEKDQDDKEDDQNETESVTKKIIKKDTNNMQNKTNKTNKIIKKNTPLQSNKKLTSVSNTAKTLIPEVVNRDKKYQDDKDDDLNKTKSGTKKITKMVTNNIQIKINKTNKITKNTVECEELETKAFKSCENNIKSTNTRQQNKKKEQVSSINTLMMPSTDTVQECKNKHNVRELEIKIFDCNNHVKTNTVQDNKNIDKVMSGNVITERTIITFPCDNQKKSLNVFPNNGKLRRELSRLDSSFISYSELLKLSDNSLDSQKDNSMILRKRNNDNGKNNSRPKNPKLNTSLRVLRTRMIDITNSLNSSNMDIEQPVKSKLTSQKENKSTKKTTTQVKNKDKNLKTNTTDDTIEQIKHNSSLRGRRNIPINSSTHLKGLQGSNRPRQSDISFSLKT